MRVWTGRDTGSHDRAVTGRSGARMPLIPGVMISVTGEAPEARPMREGLGRNCASLPLRTRSLCGFREETVR